MIPGECFSSDIVLGKMAILLALTDGRYDRWQKFIKKCFVKDSEFLAQSDIARGSVKNIDKLFKRIESKNPVRGKRIRNIYNARVEQRKGDSSLLLLKYFVELSNKKRAFNKFKAGQKYLRLLEKQPDGLFKTFLMIVISIDNDNKYWAKSLIRKLVRSDVEEIIFLIQKRNFSSQTERNVFLFSFLKYLTIVSKTIKSKKLSKVWWSYFSEILNGVEFDQAVESEDSKMSLLEIRDIIHSKNYGWPYAGVWLKVLSKRKNEVELMSYWHNVVKRLDIKKIDYSLLTFSIDHFPTKDEERQKLNVAIARLAEDKRDFSRYLTLQLLNNISVKKYLGSRQQKYLRPMFTLRRDFNKSLLSRALSVEFAIFNLLLIGDRDRDMLWRFIL